ncbi:MAG: hypothetical protein Q8N61_01185, partial [bacterium]|nr:hypothetical protein [bacterium]
MKEVDAKLAAQIQLRIRLIQEDLLPLALALAEDFKLDAEQTKLLRKCIWREKPEKEIAEAQEIISSLDKFENRERLVKILKKKFPEVTPQDLQGCKTRDVRADLERIYRIDKSITNLIVDEILISPHKWCLYYALTEDGKEIPLFNEKELEGVFQGKYGCSLSEGIKGEKSISIEGKECKVKEGKGLVLRLVETKPKGPWIPVGTTIRPGELKPPFDESSLSIRVELPGDKICLHEAIHTARMARMILLKYSQRPSSEKRLLEGLERTKRKVEELPEPEKSEQLVYEIKATETAIHYGITDEITAYWDDVVRLEWMTWEEVREILREDTLPGLMEVYGITQILAPEQIEQVSREMLEVANTAIDTVKELQEKGFSGAEIMEILFSTIAPKDIIEIGTGLQRKDFHRVKPNNNLPKDPAEREAVIQKEIQANKPALRVYVHRVIMKLIASPAVKAYPEIVGMLEE